MNAIRKVIEPVVQSSSSRGTVLQADGSMVVSAEALTRFGNGDPKQGRRDLRLLLAAERESPKWSGPTVRPDTVRVAVPEDEEALLALLMDDLKVNAEHMAVISDERVLFHIQSGTRRRGGIVGVIGPVGAPVACVILVPFQPWWSNSWWLQEVVNYVHPDHRRSSYVDALLDFVKWSSDDMTKGFGYRVPVLCGVLGAWRVRAKMALYARKFWTAGICCIYPAPPMKGN